MRRITMPFSMWGDMGLLLILLQIQRMLSLHLRCVVFCTWSELVLIKYLVVVFPCWKGHLCRLPWTGVRPSNNATVQFLVCWTSGVDSALVGATDANGKSIFAGKEATGFSNAEEEAVKMTDVWVFVPYAYSSMKLTSWSRSSPSFWNPGWRNSVLRIRRVILGL